MFPQAREWHPLLSLDRTSDGRDRASHLLVIHAHPYTHTARRQITRGGFHCVRLFHISSDREAFHDQWYKKAGRT